MRAIVAPVRTGFTLVELLVVIAIIGMLVGLLLPAVQQAREAARQMQCRNHLRQMALAALNHESSLQKLPSGGWHWYMVGDADRGLGLEQPGAWHFSLLPFLEQTALYQLCSDGDREQVSDNQKEGARQCLETPLSIFHCPSRRATKSYPYVNSSSMGKLYNANQPTQVARCDYAGNHGSRSSSCQSSTMNPANYQKATEMTQNQTWDHDSNGNAIRENGIVYRRSGVTLGEIRDGTTQTYLLGEKYLPADQYESGLPQVDNEGAYFGAVNDNQRSCYYDPKSTSFPNRPCQDRPGYTTPENAFGSAHSGGLGMAMCDGSVQWLVYSIEPEVHAALGNRQDGTAVSLPQ
ncbi:MAG: DUF1559 domain-containing protein [Planctomycetia bacterium]|nr:DUF1559 domain-containing protein [Planctomycetia bacterium]